MPSAAAFKKGFGIETRTRIGDFSISKSDCGHVVKEEFEKYEFPLTITLTPLTDSSGSENFNSVFSVLVQQSRIIYSEYGSPYECKFGKFKIGKPNKDGVFTVSSKGTGVRRRDIPTIAEEKKVERVKSGVDDLEDQILRDSKETLSVYRLIKSRYGTSKCSYCSLVLDPGQRIARRKTEDVLGWIHVGCAVDAEANPEKVKQLGEKREETPKKGRGKKKEDTKEEEASEAATTTTTTETTAKKGTRQKRKATMKEEADNDVESDSDVQHHETVVEDQSEVGRSKKSRISANSKRVVHTAMVEDTVVVEQQQEEEKAEVKKSQRPKRKGMAK